METSCYPSIALLLSTLRWLCYAEIFTSLTFFLHFVTLEVSMCLIGRVYINTIWMFYPLCCFYKSIMTIFFFFLSKENCKRNFIEVKTDFLKIIHCILCDRAIKGREVEGSDVFLFFLQTKIQLRKESIDRRGSQVADGNCGGAAEIHSSGWRIC